MEAGGGTPPPPPPPPATRPPQRGARGPGRSPAPGVLLALLALLAVSVSGAGVSRDPGQQRQPPRRVRRGWVWSQLVVPEEDPTPRVIGKLESDFSRWGFSIRYILSGEGAGDAFAIDEYSGEISTRRKLDREEKAFYVLQAQAIDRSTQEPVEPQSEFIIQVQDINDNPPLFQEEPYVCSIPEMSPTGTTVARVTATDADDPQQGNHARLLYSILQGEPYFSVEPKTGLIVTSWPSMDREARDQYLVVLEVKDMLGQPGAYSASTTVTVFLSDVNDNGPTFQHHQYTFGVREDAAVGTTVGRVRAEDADEGLNALMNYTLQDLEESDTFSIQLDPDTQEGLVLLNKPLDFETKSRFVMAVEADNVQVDERFLSAEASRDRATVKVFVADVDEPPAFGAAAYEWRVPESAGVGTEVGVVSARDTDAQNNPVRYSIERHSDSRKAFRIDPNNGSVTLSQTLDREASDWHNVTVVATETKQGYLSSAVQVLVRVVDVNDNAPALARDYRPFVCEGTAAGEQIQVLVAVDPDEPLEGHHFYFSMVPDAVINPNFTIRDHQDNTASIVTRRSTFTLKDRAHYLLPVVVADSGAPPLTSTSTLTVTVCRCQPPGRCPLGGGGVEAQALSMGASLKALLGLLVCLATLSALSVLALVMRRRRRRRKQQEVSGMEEDVDADDLELPDQGSQKVLRYGEPRAPGPQLASSPYPSSPCSSSPCSSSPPPVPLRPHPRRRDRKLRRAEVAASIRMSLRHSHLIGPEDEVFRQFIFDRLDEADRDPYVPPFDCLRTYAFEGAGSAAGSLSSLDSCGLADLGPETAPGGRPRPYVVPLTPWYGSEEDTF